jgi:Cu2+-exporting ATPase
VLLGNEGEALAWFHLTDQLRPGSVQGVRHLRELGIDITLITGDNWHAARGIAGELGIANVLAEVTPEEKMRYIRSRLTEQQELMMVGDGVNDIAALNLATTSIVVKDASDFVQAGSDAIILSNRIDDLPRAVRLARRTRRIILQNLAWALVYNLVGLPFAVAGWVEPWLAALGMSLSSLLVVGNSIRLNRVRI